MAKVEREPPKEGKYFFSSYEEVKNWAAGFVSLLRKNTVVALHGNLGAGKTSFVKACAPFLGIAPSLVTSPTFSYLHVYEGDFFLYHFDLYRIFSLEDFLHLGFEEYFTKTGICLIEWPEKIASILPKETLHLHWDFANLGRMVTFKKELSLCLQ